MSPRYEIRLRGHGGGAAAAAFPEFDVVVDGPVLLLRAELDQAALNGTLERIRVLRLELLDVRRSRRPPRRRTSRGGGEEGG